MNYEKRFGNYAVKIGFNTLAWFKDYEKALAKYLFYANVPEELDDTLTLVDIKTGEILMSVEPIEE